MNASLQHCLRLIETKAALGPASEWTQSHFEYLSEQIFEATHTRLSAVTLKRVWGRVAYQSSPSGTTLDALAGYLGYQHWIDFLQQQGEPTAPPAPQWLSWWKQAPAKWIGLGILLVAVTGITLGLLRAPDPVRPDRVSFRFEPVTGGIPNTVTFHYDVAESQADSMFLQQSWDPHLRQRLQPTENLVTSTYYYPGAYRAKLILNDEIAVEKNLLIPSGGWLGTIDRSPVPVYLSKETIVVDSMLQIRPEDLTKVGYDLNREIPWTAFHLIGGFDEVNPEDFRMDVRLRHTLPQGNAICQKVQVMILGGDTPIIIPLSIKGCVGELTVYAAGLNLDGERNELSSFGVDFGEAVGLTAQVQSRILKIFVNQNEALELELPQPLTSLAGVRVRFHGIGEVQSFHLSSNGRERYSFPR